MEQVLKVKDQNRDAVWGSAIKAPLRNYHPDSAKDLANAVMPGQEKEKENAIEAEKTVLTDNLKNHARIRSDRPCRTRSHDRPQNGQMHKLGCKCKTN